MLNEYAKISHQKFLAREREKLRTDKCLRDAAPDLLAALRDIVALALTSGSNEPEIIAVARAAIAKAEGGS